MRYSFLTSKQTHCDVGIPIWFLVSKEDCVPHNRVSVQRARLCSCETWNLPHWTTNVTSNTVPSKKLYYKFSGFHANSRISTNQEQTKQKELSAQAGQPHRKRQKLRWETQIKVKQDMKSFQNSSMQSEAAKKMFPQSWSESKVWAFSLGR